MRRGAVAAGWLVLWAGTGGTALLADPLFSRPETVNGRILVFPDHRAANVYHYVPSGILLSRAFGRPQFLF